MKELEKIASTVSGAASKAVNAADKAILKGKAMVETAALLRRHEKALQALGTLVYTLHKRNEENTLLLNRYLQAIERIELKLKEYNTDVAFAAKTHVCVHCGQKVNTNAVFCRLCGEKLQ